MNKRAFTLAEILITLMIIGIVASMTIPSLIKTINEIQYRITYKKVYSLLNQVTIHIMTDNAGTMKGATSAFPNNNIAKYTEYLKTVKICSGGTALGDCWVQNGEVKNSSGNIITHDSDWAYYNDNYPGMILVDGSSLLFSFGTSPSCAQYEDPFCFLIWIDVNGPNKQPNQWCKDLYVVQIRENGVRPDGYNDHHYKYVGPSSECNITALEN